MNNFTRYPIFVLATVACLFQAFICVPAATATPGAQKWAFTTGTQVNSSPAIGTDGTVYVGSEDHNVYALDGQTRTQKWAFATGSYVVSSPSIGADGTVYVGSADQKVYALDGQTGAPRWTFQTAGTTTSPSIGADGTVYVGSADDKVYALDGQTGTPRWTFQTAGVTASPAIGADGTVYVGSFNSVCALDGQTGTQKWAFATGYWLGSSPAIDADGTVYVGSCDSRIYALDGQTGAQKWDFQTGNWVTSSPAIGSDGTVYVGSEDHNVYALDRQTGTQKWAFETGAGVESSPAIGADGTVYVGSRDHNLYALDGQTGTQKWAFLTGNEVYSSPAIGMDGTVYVGGFDHKVYAIVGNSSGGPQAGSPWPMFHANVRHTGRSPGIAPVVTTQPADTTVCAGNTATFTAAASGNPAPTVQWQVSTDGGWIWADINGATSGTLTVATTLSMRYVWYRAVFTNSVGTATSGSAMLFVNTAPVVFIHPNSVALLLDPRIHGDWASASATFYAAASGIPEPTIQWQVSTNDGTTWGDIAGATFNTLTIHPAWTSGKYRAVFTNSCGVVISNAATLTVTVVKPDAPYGLIASPCSGQANLTWIAVPGATSYNIYVSTAQGVYGAPTFTGVTGTAFTVTNLTNGVMYYFVITEVTYWGESVFSNLAQAMPLAAPRPPTSVTPVVLNNGVVEVVWKQSPDATIDTRYIIRRSTSITGPYTVLVSGVSAMATEGDWLDTTAVNGVTYYYTVSAIGQCGLEGAPSAPGVVVAGLPPSQPYGLTRVSYSGSVTLNWIASAGAVTYNIKRRPSTQPTYGAPLATGVMGTTYVDSTVQNGVIYYYVVSASNPSGESTNSNEVAAAPVNALPAPTTVTAVSVVNRRVDLSWNQSVGARASTSYNIKRSTTGAPGSYTTIVSGLQALAYLDTTVTDGVRYFYTVSATNLGVTGAESTAVSVIAGVRPSQPYGLTRSSFSGSVTLNWIAAGGSDIPVTYNIKRRPSTQPTYGAPIATGIVGTTYVDNTAQNGVIYFYVVSASNAVGESDNSNEVAAAPVNALPAPTTVTAVSVINGRVDLRWNQSVGALASTSYNIKRSTTGAAGSYTTLVSGLQALAYLDTSVSNGVRYYYTISATNLGVTGAESTPVSVIAGVRPTQPYGLTRVSNSGCVTFNWIAAGSAIPVTYNIKRRPSTQPTYGAPIATGVMGTTYVDNTAQNGVIYFYVVSASNAVGESDNSNEVAAAPVNALPAPAIVSAVVHINGRVDLNWSASVGAQASTTYNIKRSLTGAGGPYTTVVSGLQSLSYLDTTAPDGVTAFYTISATNLGVTGPESTPISIVTGVRPLQPYGLIGASGVHQVSLTWVASSGSTTPVTYIVQRSFSPGGPYTTIATGVMGPMYTDTTGAVGVTYFYQVIGVNASGVSDVSNYAWGTPSN